MIVSSKAYWTSINYIGKNSKIMIFCIKGDIFRILAISFLFLCKIPERWPHPDSGTSPVLVHKSPPLKTLLQLEGHSPDSIWTLSLLYTSADKYKSLGFYEKLLTLISCNFLSLGNLITFFVSGNTSSSSSFECARQILRISKLSRNCSGTKWVQFAVLACAPA